jgi:tRNA pseudouridine38-40 synthase
MDNYKLTIAYDGTDFHGWQQQKNQASIQQIIKEAIEKHLQHPIRLIGSGRTDAGVHALGQVAHFHSASLNLDRFLYSVNSLLPPSIRLLSLEKVDPSFHAQHSALSKTYHYHLFLNPIMNPMRRLFSWKPPMPIDLALLTEAIPHFIGTHDFTTFANRGSATDDDPIRTLYSIILQSTDDGCCLIFTGNGFLYRMVRNITGTLVAIGSGRLQPQDVPILLALKDRRKAPQAAPPTGLFLAEVRY